MLYEFWHNFTHNLFKPLLLFFYLGFFIPILKVKFEFPYVLYQGLTMYLLLAIGWHGGEQLANIDSSGIVGIAGFMMLGFVVNGAIGLLAYALLTRMTSMRRVDSATVAGYYGSDSAGTFATCVGVLGAIGMTFDAYMPVMLAIMEIPGAMVALLLVARLRRRGMGAAGNMPDEPAEPGEGASVDDRVLVAEGARHESSHVHDLDLAHERALADEVEIALEKQEHAGPAGTTRAAEAPASLVSGALLREVLLNPGLYLLLGGIVVGFVAGLQGEDVTRSGDLVFVNAFQGVLCLFLLEMGMTAARKLKDLKDAGRGLVAFGVLAPNVFAALGMTAMHGYAQLTNTSFELGNYVLFAVLCGSASYIAVPAVQRLAIPEASPTLPLAASLGLTFTYNVTIGIPIYIQLAQAITGWLPIG